MNYSDNLILYEDALDMRKNAINYVNNLTSSFKRIISVPILLHRNDESIINDINRVPLLNFYFADLNISSNIVLSILGSQFAKKIGTDYFEGQQGHAVILFDLDIVQMDYLYHLKKNSELTYHLFMKKSNFYDTNLLVNLKDYFSVMNFEIHNK
ncbi:hypothetical protein [Paenibacillus sp. OAS669]|uniref:hypothetical protein n=1 Tax=Paenibacillus sp. OAS669 TaxID=2663821 RepID=UPI00178B8D41|nr:hypothetical protein [Paenibacillus sp. OAS669]MBE1446073.1 hypothetical protein [Paenibacillus sp. OAS669]